MKLFAMFLVAILTGCASMKKYDAHYFKPEVARQITKEFAGELKKYAGDATVKNEVGFLCNEKKAFYLAARDEFFNAGFWLLNRKNARNIVFRAGEKFTLEGLYFIDFSMSLQSKKKPPEIVISKLYFYGPDMLSASDFMVIDNRRGKQWEYPMYRE